MDVDLIIIAGNIEALGINLAVILKKNERKPYVSCSKKDRCSLFRPWAKGSSLWGIRDGTRLFDI